MGRHELLDGIRHDLAQYLARQIVALVAGDLLHGLVNVEHFPTLDALAGTRYDRRRFPKWFPRFPALERQRGDDMRDGIKAQELPCVRRLVVRASASTRSRMTTTTRTWATTCSGTKPCSPSAPTRRRAHMLLPLMAV